MLAAIREVGIVTRNLASARDTYHRALGLDFRHERPTIEQGVASASMATGAGTRITLVQPQDASSAAGKALARRGEGLYLIGYEATDMPVLRDRLSAHGGFALTRLAGDEGVRCVPQEEPGFVMEFRTRDSARWADKAGGDWNGGPATIRQIRQVGVLVRDLDAAVGQWDKLFGLRPTRNHYPVGWSGIEVAVIPLKAKTTFVELVQPTDPTGSPAQRLERIGEGLWLTVLEVQDFQRALDRIKGSGVQISRTSEEIKEYRPTLRSVWLHPRAFSGAFVQLIQVCTPDNPWPLAGEQWWRNV